LLLDDTAKQTEFAALVGTTQQAIAKHVKQGSLSSGGTYRDWILSYCEKLRKSASGRRNQQDQLSLDQVRIRDLSASAQIKELTLFKEHKLVLDREQVREAMDAWIIQSKSEYESSIEKILAMIESQTGNSLEREPINRIVESTLRVIGDFNIESAESD
jgi:hypothetical protein